MIHAASSIEITYHLVDTYRQRVEKILLSCMEHLHTDSELAKACRYAILTPGKRLRPILLLAIAEALGAQWKVEKAAVAVEMFHCASLIADDLPCMDNDDMRRGQPTVHKVYGESTAILATYVLISEGYKAIYECAMELKHHNVQDAELRGLKAVENVAFNAGIDGAAGGQYVDLMVKAPSLDQLEVIFQKKTASIFEISCILGWLFGGGNLNRLDDVKSFAYHLGLAFQILDDLDDLKQDASRNPINYARMVGPSQALAKAKTHLEAARSLMSSFDLKTPIIQAIVQILMTKAL